MSTRTRFEKEAKGNSEMAYLFLMFQSERLVSKLACWSEAPRIHGIVGNILPVLLTNRQEISRSFPGSFFSTSLVSSTTREAEKRDLGNEVEEISAFLRLFAVFFSVWTMKISWIVAVFGNGSKKIPHLHYCCFPVDPRICSLHFEETDIAISISGRKNIPQAAIWLSLTLQKRRIWPVRARSVLTIERSVVLNN